MLELKTFEKPTSAKHMEAMQRELKLRMHESPKPPNMLMIEIHIAMALAALLYTDSPAMMRWAEEHRSRVHGTPTQPCELSDWKETTIGKAHGKLVEAFDLLRGLALSE
jgi:hypothetical protein